MRLQNLLEDDDAVSPVIGVILMVAITVILAAVIASFVLGLGPGEAQPSASFSFDDNTTSAGSNGIAGNVTVTHDNGDSIAASELYIRGNGLNQTGEWTNTGATSGSASGTQDGDSAVTSGDNAIISYHSDYELRVVWDNGDNSATLSETSGSA